MREGTVEDRYEIEQLLYRYAWMVDERQWELMDDVFAPHGVIDYTSTGGAKGPYRETLHWLDRALSGWPINLHTIGNITIEFDGDSASSRCHFIAPMARLRADGTQEVISNAGYYIDTLVRIDGRWLIEARLCTQTIMAGQLPPGYEIPG
jgi:3-phenylpropionate/cinnamic acid dioxygenase small subunit